MLFISCVIVIVVILVFVVLFFVLLFLFYLLLSCCFYCVMFFCFEGHSFLLILSKLVTSDKTKVYPIVPPADASFLCVYVCSQ